GRGNGLAMDLGDPADAEETDDLADRKGDQRQQRKRRETDTEPAECVVAGEQAADEIVDREADGQADEAAECREEKSRPAAAAARRRGPPRSAPASAV